MKQTNDLNNKYRVLLTEVLPYELPLVLNNEAFYENMQDDSLRNLFVSVFSKCMNKRIGRFHLTIMSVGLVVRRAAN